MNVGFKSFAAKGLLTVSIFWSVCAQTAGIGEPAEVYQCLKRFTVLVRRPGLTREGIWCRQCLVSQVDEKGHVLDPKVVSSSGSKGFDQDASLAVLT